MSSAEGPRVVVLGGCGFIGRNMVELLVSERLASVVRVVDKTPPQTAWLAPRHARLFDNPLVEFRSANLINPASCAAALEPPAAGAWDLVVNCAGETRPDLPDAVYEEGIVALSGLVARSCLQSGARLVQLSSSELYPSDEKGCSEDSRLEAWSAAGRCYERVEQMLRDLPGLRYTVLRPALVYGSADRRSLMPRLLVGGVYKHLGETMKLLWTAGLKLHTVHVRDVCRAAWHVGSRADTLRRVYNVVDEADSTQGSVTDLIAQIFGIKYEFVGSALSLIAKTDLAAVAEDANAAHLSAWAAACAGVAHTPLEPRAPADQLRRRHRALCGAALAATGFTVDVPAPTVRNLREILEEYADMKVFPRALLD